MSLLTSIKTVARNEQRLKGAADIAQIQQLMGTVLMSLAKCDLLMIIAGRRPEASLVKSAHTPWPENKGKPDVILQIQTCIDNVPELRPSSFVIKFD